MLCNGEILYSFHSSLLAFQMHPFFLKWWSKDVEMGCILQEEKKMRALYWAHVIVKIQRKATAMWTYLQHSARNLLSSCGTAGLSRTFALEFKIADCPRAIICCPWYCSFPAIEGWRAGRHRPIALVHPRSGMLPEHLFIHTFCPHRIWGLVDVW